MFTWLVWSNSYMVLQILFFFLLWHGPGWLYEKIEILALCLGFGEASIVFCANTQKLNYAMILTRDLVILEMRCNSTNPNPLSSFLLCLNSPPLSPREKSPSLS